ncbi:hypothetical protein J53TS2_24020 [Paenibacillus sp. J53TS2]|nr:hypothetical protein J53TS2_24020 [Paenibacillus sp. J53TS2]
MLIFCKGDEGRIHPRIKWKVQDNLWEQDDRKGCALRLGQGIHSKGEEVQ